jgi:hypothetical protein
MVPVSMGAKELGECVTTPTTFIFLEKYFCVPGKILQPEPKRQAHESMNRIRGFELDRKKAFIIKYKYVNITESIRNVRIVMEGVLG